jgi:fructose-1,6-bisphosphatase/inositol monophosphatase family enzyme
MLLSYIEEGVPVLGACLFPAWQVFLGVGPGTPAFERQGRTRRLLPRARARTPLSRAVIFHGGSGWWFRTPYAAGFRRLVQSCYLERAYGDCAGYLWAFRGHVDAVIDCGVKIWDIAPMAALARATGRTLTDFDNRISFTGPYTILAAPALARVIARTLRKNSP